MTSEQMPLIVLGTGTFAVEVASVAQDAGFSVSGFAENENRARCDEPLEGLPVHWVDELGELATTHSAILGFGTTLRSRFAGQAEAAGMKFATVAHPSAQVAQSAVLGTGCVVGPAAVIGARTELGSHVLVNRGALIGHHSRIGDFTSVGPGANLAGNVTVDTAVYVGMGTVVINGVQIGAHSILGAGAVVVGDLPSNVLAVGVPARVVRRDVEGM